MVTAAGNLGKNANGQLQHGGITAPGNAPWVLTVGAFSHEGTVIRTDDVMAGIARGVPPPSTSQLSPIWSLRAPASSVEHDVCDEIGLSPGWLAPVGSRI